MRLDESLGRSLLAHRVQLKVSPTYAEPKDTGRLRIGLSRKGAVLVSTFGRYASDAGTGADGVAFELSGGSTGYCVTRDGRESRSTLSEMACGSLTGSCDGYLWWLIVSIALHAVDAREFDGPSWAWCSCG
jgi:hypothetical protein